MGTHNMVPRTELWTRDTDLVLRDLVLRSSEVDWNQIATAIEWDSGAVTPSECKERWDCMKDTPVKGPWSSEEDDHLKRLVDEFGSKKWNLLARAFPGRSGKQCRERWHNHVDGRVKKGEWSAEEDQILCEAQRQLGNKWSEMSKILTGRSENAIKNRFNSLNAKGLAELRANELMSKLPPEEKAELMSHADPPPVGARSSASNGKKKGGANRDASKDKPNSCKSSSSSSSSSSRSSSSIKASDADVGKLKVGDKAKVSHVKKGTKIKSSGSNNKSDDGGIGGGSVKKGVKINSSSGSSSSSRSSSSSNNNNNRNKNSGIDRGSVNIEGSSSKSNNGGIGNGGSSKADGGESAPLAKGFENSATRGCGGSREGDGKECGGGKRAPSGGAGGSAAMQALMFAARDERTACVERSGEEGDGDTWNRGLKAGAGKKRGWFPVTGTGGGRRGRPEDASDGAELGMGMSGTKRARVGPARWKTDTTRAEAGMSVLAQAAGLLDDEDSAEEDGSSTSGETRRNGSSASGIVDCRGSLSIGAGSSVHPYGRLDTGRHRGNIPDHGSTPPGSASPPPSGPASGGVLAASDPYGGSGGGGDRTAWMVDAFAVGTRETVRTGAESIERRFEHSRGGGTGGAGGGTSSYGSERSGGERASSGGPPSLSQRRSLHSVPGPWRRYWTGQDEGNGGGGGAAAATAAPLHRHEEGLGEK